MCVWVDLPGGRNTFCEGDSLTPIVRVSQPARVQVYAVLRDGTAHLVWPGPYRGDDRIEGTEELFSGTLVANPDAGDESLVAVAVSLPGGFGVSRGWTGYCHASDDFGEAFYPPGAAVHRVSYTVRPPGVGCPVVDVSEAHGDLAAVPMCAP